ncbi:MDR family MFS transporter [Nonomuraea sp. NPDC049480]|uniref:MDR family MFS transporter n=1 Tax=Nonomuraea sp. NPDC049480 TaxID=3364353 RepID=UPI0037932217
MLGALMLCISLVALDATGIAGAVPSMVGDLGGFWQFPWLFSAYLLTSAVTVPIYGKLADLFGRRSVLYFGIGVFLLGSVLCGLAWNMPVLIVSRAVQGIGAGAVLPISMTVLGDLYDLKERAAVQGYLSSVWGVAAVIGPAVGGSLSQYLSWRLIFLINVPVGALALWMLARHLHERITPQRRRIDYTGAALLTTGCSLVILGLLQGGVAWSWRSTPSIAVLASGAALLVAFVLFERRSPAPILPLWVFTRRSLAGGNLSGLIVGVMLMGLTSYVPVYVQGVLGHGAIMAGVALGGMSIGWPLSSSLSGHLYLRIGFRGTTLIGSVLVFGGALMAALLGQDTGVWAMGAASLTAGVGLGLVATCALVSVQSAVGWADRGVVTASNMFCRSLGSAVGIAVFGAVANATLMDRLSRMPPGLNLPSTLSAAGDTLLSRPELRGSAAGAFVEKALYAAVHDVFVGLVIASAIGLAVALLIPRRIPRPREVP